MTFEDLPQPADDDEPNYAALPWHGPPPDVLGAVVPLSEGAIVATGHLFVGLRYVTAYPMGVSFSLVIAARRGGLSSQRWQALEASVWASDSFSGAQAPGAGGLRWGVELTDGVRASTSDPSRRGPDGAPQAPVLIETGGTGSGGEREVERQLDLWLWPLPEGETLFLELRWPDLEVPVSVHRLDLDPVREAAQRARPFWP